MYMQIDLWNIIFGGYYTEDSYLNKQSNNWSNSLHYFTDISDCTNVWKL